MLGRRKPSRDQLLASLVQWRLQTGDDRDLSDDEAVHRASGMRRREFLQSVMFVGAGVGLAACTGAPAPTAAATAAPTASSAASPRVVVVGAGLAGLTAAYRLHQAGVAVQVFEARDRVGGRCWSSTGWVDGRIAEHGGEFIDSRHVHILGLAKEFGIALGDTWAYWDPKSVSHAWVDGAAVKEGQVLGPINDASRLLARTARKNGSYFAGEASRRAVAFDEMTEADWVREVTGESIESPMGRLFSRAQASDFGLDADQLSATNLLDYYSVQWHGANERYTFDGGNSRIPDALNRALPSGAVTLDSALQSIRRVSDGTFELAFSDAHTPVVADYVVLSIPFTTLREVDLTDAGLSADKRAAIDQLGMGTNSKVLLQFDRPYQDFGDWSSYLQYGDDPQFETWESSGTDKGGGNSSLITVYGGGRAGATFPTDSPHGVAPVQVTQRILRAMEPMLPGITAAQIGDAWLDNWSADPWVRGSYAAFRPGNVTSFRGRIGQAEGRLHFAGEHTSVFSQGYLNGGVESGGRAAAELLDELGLPHPEGLARAMRDQQKFEPTYPWT